MSGMRAESSAYPPWKTNVAKSGAVTAVMAAAMLAAGDPELSNMVVGVPPFMFMVYVVLTSRSYRRARRTEEAAEMDAAMGLIAQLGGMLSRMGGLGEAHGGHVSHMAFSHILATVRLLSSQYGRYLDGNAALAVQEAEKTVIDASLPRKTDSEEHFNIRIELLAEQVEAIKAGVLDIDDPRLRAMREAP